MADEENVVVPFPRGQFERERNRRQATMDELPVRSAPFGRSCDHRRAGVTVDEQARTVRCRGCQVEMDPIAVLGSLAHQRENLVHAGFRLRDEVESLSTRVERLRKDETNVKARIRAAKKRAPDDRHALEAAAQARRHPDGAPIRVGGYRPWDELGEGQRQVVLVYISRIVDAYFGALAAGEGRQTA
jgi:hypothetical protein